MKSLNKKILTFIFVVAFAILMPFGNVKAVLQANPNTHCKKTDSPENWMSNIRNMEKSGQAMGLGETLNSDLTASSESNGIDVHMMKSTEYGAIAILSASGYGNPTTLQKSSIKTTTGNKTGVYFSGSNYEYVAGGLTGYIYKKINAKYYDIYTSDISSAKVGDALGSGSTINPGCANWHSTGRTIMPTNWEYPYLKRGGDGLFSFHNSDRITYTNNIYVFCGRGVAIVGEGL